MIIKRVDLLEEIGERYTGLLPKPIQTDRLKLRNLVDVQMRALFTLQELQDAYFSTGVEWDNASGGKADRVRFLITHHLNHDTTKRLLLYLRQERPGREWPDL